MKRQTDSRFLACGARIVRNATLLLLVSAGAFVGCKQGRGDRCQQDSDCGSGLVCGASCSLANSTCTCEPIVGVDVGSGGTTVVSTGGTTGSGGAGGAPDQGQGGGAGGEAGGTNGDTGGAGVGGGGGTAAGGESGAGGGVGGAAGATSGGGAGGA